jgi:hypothetical protein
MRGKIPYFQTFSFILLNTKTTTKETAKHKPKNINNPTNSLRTSNKGCQAPKKCITKNTKVNTNAVFIFFFILFSFKGFKFIYKKNTGGEIKGEFL